MPTHQLRLTSIITTLENGTRLASALGYPEVSAYGRIPEKLVEEVQRRVAQARERLPRLELGRRHAAGEPEVREVTVTLDPPRGGTAWVAPLALVFHAVEWTHGKAAAIAYVPALDIAMVAARPEELMAKVEEHVRFALAREKASGSLERLARYGRVRSVQAAAVQASVDDKTPKQIARERGEKKEASVLGQVATNLAHFRRPDTFGMDETVLKLAEWLVGERPRSVLLAGPSGVGKTAAVYELVRQRGSLELGRTPFWSTSGARIVAGMTGYGMWQDRCQDLCREAAKTKAVVHVGNLVELMEVGQHEGNDQGVGEFLRPYVERGDLLAVAECTVEQAAKLEREAPNMLEAFARVDVQEPDEKTGLAILLRAAQAKARRTRNRCTEEAVRALDRLHRRFATYSAYPGRPLRFLDNLMKDAPEGRILDPADVTTAFSRETGLPLMLLEEKEQLRLDDTREWFSGRVIGQEQAVDVVVNLLATVKACLSRPERPIASLLFIGPTGVGKTEMAKALADFLYQDPQRMTRVDMSEYAEYASIDRLLGGAGRSEGLLTAKVREQPFGVVLLDEFEKAHPRFFDLLLQVLGEGRLTDAAGRVADFRNCVIIMTSNLGTASFARPAIGFGGTAEPTARAEEHFTREVRQFVRPELFNRIDRIVPFLPLGPDTLRAIAGRELELLRAREGLRFRDLAIDFGADLADEIVRLGYDPRYGARPIKRAIDRHLLAPLASGLNDAVGDLPLEATVEPAASGIRIQVRARAAGDVRASGEALPQREDPLVRLAAGATRLRRESAFVDASHAILDVRNQVYWLERLAEQIGRKRKRRLLGESAKSLERLAPLQKIARRSGDLVTRTAESEEAALLALYAAEPLEMAEAQRRAAALGDELQSLMIDVFVLGLEESDFLNLVVYGEHADEVFMLAQAYHALAVNRQFRIEAYEIVHRTGPPRDKPDRFALGDKDSDDERKRKQANGTSLEAVRIERPGQYLLTTREGLVGIALCLWGKLAQPMLRPEEGAHVFAERQRKLHCLVHASDAAMRQYQPPERIDRRDAIKGQPVRRTYDATKELIDDPRADGQRRWTGDDLADVLRRLVEELFLARVRAWFEP